MSQFQKLLERFNSKPIRNDITFAEIEKLASAYGCKVMPGGKHMRVVHPPTGTVIPIPRHGKTVEEAYIKQLKDLFEEIGNIQEVTL